MPSIEGTITAVHSRDGNRKSDNKPFTVFEVIVDGDISRKYQTFSRSIANEANRYLNQIAEVEYHSEVRGSFENYYLDDIRPPTSKDYSAPAQGFTQPPQPARVDQLEQQYQQQLQKPAYEAQIPPAPPMNGAYPVAKDWSIWRQTAAKVSAHLSRSPAEFWSNIDDLVEYFHNGKKPERFLQFVPPVVHHERDMSRSQREPQEQFLPAGSIDGSINDQVYEQGSEIPF